MSSDLPQCLHAVAEAVLGRLGAVTQTCFHLLYIGTEQEFSNKTSLQDFYILGDCGIASDPINGFFVLFRFVF